MLLTFDIGNTNVKAAIFENEKIIFERRTGSDEKRTGDEYFSIFITLMHNENIDTSKIEEAVVSSVVPQLTGPFISVAQRIIGKKPLVVGPEIYNKLPVKIPAEAVHQIGTDLLCDAFMAWEIFKKACIIADFGTALSFTAVNDQGEICGIAIAPGIGTAFASLNSSTAQLPSVSPMIPATSLGTNTIDCIRAGVMFGYRGLTESIINQMKSDMHKKYGTQISDIKTVATGGLNSMIQPISNVFDLVDKELTVNGLRKIALCALK